MPLPVIANTVRAAVSGLTPAGTPWANIWHFRHTTAPGPTELANLNTRLGAFYDQAIPSWSTGHGVLYNSNTNCTMTQVVMTPLDGSSPSAVYSHSHAGGDASDSLPPDCCEVLTLRTAIRGRAYRGRIYLPCWAEVRNGGNGRMTAGSNTATVSLFTDFIGALSTVGWTPVVASYKNSLATDVVGGTMDTLFDRQRRRKS